MDIKSRSKAANIVLSILIFLFSTGMFELLFASQLMIIAPGVRPTDYGTTFELFQQSINYFRNIASYSTSEFPSFVVNLIRYGGYAIILLASFITYFVHFIIVTIRTIQGLAGKDTSKSIIKHLLAMITAIVGYIAYLVAVYHQQTFDVNYVITIGVGPFAMLGICLGLFVICAIIRISYMDDRPVTTRVIKVIISLFSIGGSLLMFAAVCETYYSTLNALQTTQLLLFNLIPSSGTPQQELVLFAAIGINGLGFIIAAFTTFHKLIAHSFGFIVDKKDRTKEKEVGTSLIARTILELVLTGIAFALIWFSISRIFPTYHVSFSKYLISAMGFAFISIILAIIHKCLDKEVPVTPIPIEESKLKIEIEDNRIEPIAIIE